MTNSVAPQLDTIVYGQGKCLIQLTKFDNVFKFVLLNVSGTSTLPMNISGQKLYLKFIQDNDQTVSIKNAISEEVFPEMGEVVFNVMKEDAVRILKIRNDKAFYIVSKQDDAAIETVIYRGMFEKFTEGVEVDEETVKPFELLLNEEQERIDKATEENEAKQIELDVLLENNQQLQENLVDEISTYKTRIEELERTANPDVEVTTSDIIDVKPEILPADADTAREIRQENMATSNAVRFIRPVSTKPQVISTDIATTKPLIAQPPPPLIGQVNPGTSTATKGTATQNTASK